MIGKTLTDEDKRVVDLLLNQTRQMAGNDGQDVDGDGQGNGFASSVPHVFNNRRLSAAEKWMRVLDAMPAEEPSADLVQRTMRRIEQHTDVRVPAALRPTIGQRPQA